MVMQRLGGVTTLHSYRRAWAYISEITATKVIVTIWFIENGIKRCSKAFTAQHWQETEKSDEGQIGRRRGRCRGRHEVDEILMWRSTCYSWDLYGDISPIMMLEGVREVGGWVGGREGGAEGGSGGESVRLLQRRRRREWKWDAREVVLLVRQLQ